MKEGVWLQKLFQVDELSLDGSLIRETGHVISK